MSTDAMHISQFSQLFNSSVSWLTSNRCKRVASLYWAAILTLGASIMHTMGVLAQWPQFVPVALLLVGLAVVQAALALIVLIFPTRRLFIIALFMNGATVLLWIIARTMGIPIGLTLWRPEQLSTVDLCLPVMEGLATLILLALVLRRPKTGRPRWWLTVLAAFPAPLLVCVITGILTIPWLGASPAASEAWLPVSSSVVAPAGQTTTLTYCQFGGHPFAIDVSEPAATVARPVPMVFYIHGGEGLTGYRQLALDQDSAYFLQLRDELLARGFAVGSIDYGLAPLYKMRDEVVQSRCAVRFLRAHAVELGINPQRIGVYGTSQGGYLAAMLGTVGDRKGFDGGQYLNQSSRVQAAVDMWGFTDLTNFSGSPGWVSSIGMLQTGGKPAPAALRANVNSPVTYVAHDNAPFLIMHGADDWFIAPHHSQDFARRLQTAGVPVSLVMIQHDGHGLAETTAGQVQRPAPGDLVHMIRDFFVKTLAS